MFDDITGSLINMLHKELKAQRLSLRPFGTSDLEFIHRHFTDPHVVQYIYDHEPPADENEAAKLLEWCMDFESKDHVRWCITLMDGSQPIGTCGYHYYDPLNKSSEIGYDLSQPHWGKGLMYEALMTMLEYGAEALDLHRIYAYVYPKNGRSIRLLGRLGFYYEGTVRDKHLYRGKYYDHDLYSLIVE